MTNDNVKSASIHAIVLTLNEEKHISRCLQSIRDVASSITVIDSGSTDQTLAIAREFGAEVVINKWINYSTQLNFGIDHLSGRRGWLFRIDADEYITAQSAASLHALLDAIKVEIDGIMVQRQIVFLGRRIRWGGIEPNWQLRLWRAGRGRCERRWMDEHIVVHGEITKSTIELVDENLNSMDWWTAKHNHYASREAIDILASRGLLSLNENIEWSRASPQAKLRRLIKEKFYNRMPGGFRSMAYVIYRYVLRLGFLDGEPGYYFHFLQGFWYRTLVDAKLKEIVTDAKKSDRALAEVILRKTGIDVASMPAKSSTGDKSKEK